MLTRKCLNNLSLLQRCVNVAQNAAKRTSSSKRNEEKDDQLNLTLGEIGTKYKVFRDSDSKVILDIHEERLKYPGLLEDEPETLDPFIGINLRRGVRGVFDIEDLVDVLKRDNAEDIFVAKVPAEVNYVDFLCVVSGKSYRHMLALSQFVRRVYKQKRHSSDIVPKLEGENSRDWIALDLGNIALHILSKDARIKYDLDALWATGAEYDKEYNKKDVIVEMLEKHAIYLKGLQPAS